jgi:hypothetical protein
MPMPQLTPFNKLEEETVNMHANMKVTKDINTLQRMELFIENFMERSPVV